MKRCSILYVIRDKEIRTIIRYHYMAISVVSSQNGSQGRLAVMEASPRTQQVIVPTGARAALLSPGL